MTMGSVYVERIKQYDADRLLNLWRDIESGKTHDQGWESGKALEYLVLRAFELEGADVRWPYNVSLHGEEVEQIDGVVYIANLACLVECKDTNKPINFEAIAKLRNQLLRRPATTIGVIMSRKGFTDAAVLLAYHVVPQSILLMEGNELAYAIENQAMRRAIVTKYRKLVEESMPNYDIRSEVLP